MPGDSGSQPRRAAIAMPMVEAVFDWFLALMHEQRHAASAPLCSPPVAPGSPPRYVCLGMREDMDELDLMDHPAMRVPVEKAKTTTVSLK